MSYDSIKPARILIRILKTNGLWSYKGDPIHPFYKLFGWTLHIFFTFLFISAMYVNVAHMDTIDNFANALYMALAETVLLVKVLNTLLMSQALVAFLESIEQDLDTQPQNQLELQMLQERQDKFIKLRNVYITGVVLVILLSYVGALMDNNYKLPFPCWLPFEYRNNDDYKYAFSYVALSMIITASTNMTIDLLQAYLLFQLASFYKVIALRLECYGPPDDVDKLKKLMRLHNFTEGMVMKCQNIISVPVFVQIVMSALILCFTAYQLQKISLVEETAEFLMMVSFAFVMTLEIYFPCYYGNEVTINADALTGAIYSSNWVDLPAQSRKLIFIYMEYLKRPIQVKAGRFFCIGIKIFTKTINNAYSLLAVLMNIKN